MLARTILFIRTFAAYGFSEELDDELEDLLRLKDESDPDPDGDSEGYFDPLGRLTLRRADPR